MSDDDPQIPFQPPQRPQHYGLPQKPRSSPIGLTVGILVILAILIGGAVAIHLLMQRNQQAAAPATPPQPAPPAKPKKLQPSAVPWPATTPTISAKPFPTTAGAVDEAPPAPKPSDPGSADWERVEQVYRTSPPEMAIIALLDFLTNSPTSTFTPTAQEQINESLDRLWWIRIQSLCKQRDEMNQKINAVDDQLRIVKKNSPDPLRVKELENEKAPYAKELEVIQGRLDEMKYTGTVTPDLYDEASLAELR
jgi:hypothetical protein